ncbi:MAG: hypothetical protein JWN76_1234 [Chitinophagaceae bacterium]|nr:hypothetical protein [Chitinophagaceae bacterium]
MIEIKRAYPHLFNEQEFSDRYLKSQLTKLLNRKHIEYYKMAGNYHLGYFVITIEHGWFILSIPSVSKLRNIEFYSFSDMELNLQKILKYHQMIFFRGLRLKSRHYMQAA